MFANRLLIRWTFGWYEVCDIRGLTQEMYDNPFDHDLWIDAPVLREAMLSLGGYDDTNAIRAVAFDQLGIYADPRTEIACDVAPIDESDTPFLGYGDGDRVTVADIDGTPVVERIQAITVTEDEDGVPSYAVELKDIILTDQERWQANLDKMAKGTMGGTSSVATPTTGYEGMGNSCCPPKPPSKWPDPDPPDDPEHPESWTVQFRWDDPSILDLGDAVVSDTYTLPANTIVTLVQWDGSFDRVSLDPVNALQRYRADTASWETFAVLDPVSGLLGSGDDCSYQSFRLRLEWGGSVGEPRDEISCTITLASTAGQIDQVVTGFTLESA